MSVNQRVGTFLVRYPRTKDLPRAVTLIHATRSPIVLSLIVTKTVSNLLYQRRAVATRHLSASDALFLVPKSACTACQAGAHPVIPSLSYLPSIVAASARPPFPPPLFPLLPISGCLTLFTQQVPLLFGTQSLGGLCFSQI